MKWVAFVLVLPIVLSVIAWMWAIWTNRTKGKSSAPTTRTSSRWSWWSRPILSVEWKNFVQTVAGWLITGTIVAVIVIYSLNGCTEMVREWKASDARTAAYEANPDNYWWELWGYTDGKWLHKSYGVNRETSQSDGRIVLSWPSDELRKIVASCIPGHEGSWKAVDGYGKSIRRNFSISSAFESEIYGNLEQKFDDDVVRLMPFKFVRKEKK